MDNSDFITLFTARIGQDNDANISLFNNKEKLVDNSVSECLFDILGLPDAEKTCFDSMTIEQQKNVIKAAYCDAPESDCRIMNNVLKAMNGNPSFSVPQMIIRKVWETQKAKVFEYAGSRWSVYKARMHSGVYAIDILQSSRDEKKWISDLVRLAKVINPNASFINIVFHSKDTNGNHDYVNYTYSFTPEDLSFLKETTDASVIVIGFSHTSSSSVYLVLKEVYEKYDKGLDESIDIVHRQVSYITKEDKDYRKRISTVENAKKAQKPADPIGDSYKQENVV